MDFWRTTAILSKRKWFILLSVIVAVGLTWGAIRLVGSRWTATVQFVSPHNSVLTSAAGQENMSGDGAEAGIEAARSQAIIYNAIVKSRDVLEPSLKAMDQNQLPPDLLKNIDFTATAPRLYQLQVSDNSAVRARQLANALADNFVRVYHSMRSEQAKKTVTLLEDQLRDADAKLVKARQNYDAYRDKHHIVGSLNANLDTALARLRETRQRHDEVEQKVADGRARLRSLEADLTKTPATLKATTPTVPGGQTTPLQNDLAKAEQQLTEMRLRLTGGNPILQRAQQSRDDLVARLKEEQSKSEVSGATQQANPTLLLMQQQARALNQEIAGDQALATQLAAGTIQAQKEIDQYKGIDGPIGAFATEVALQSEARANVQARLRNARVLLDATESQTPITIMDRVTDFNPPVNPAQGRTTKLLLMAAVSAMIIMCGLVIGLDTVDRRLRNVREAEVVLPAPVLAAIPQPMHEVTYSTLARATVLHPQSLHSEAYRFLGLQLLNRYFPAMRSFMIVSAKAEQGATTTLTNLGITLAQAGKKVILVDANIRTPELHQVFDLPNHSGYMDLLKTPDDATMETALRPTGIANLQVITSGRQPENPWELFRSPNLIEVSRQLREKADVILYDTPSSVLFTDALNLAPVVDASFLCVRALEPITGAEDRLVKLLQEAHVPVVGCVLNDVPAAVIEGYDNYQHYYRPVANAEANARVGAATTGLPSGPRLQPWIDLPAESDETGQNHDPQEQV